MRALSRRQAGFVLARNHVGRIAFIGDGRVELLPVHYVYARFAIVGRTSFGTKCMAWIERDDVAFEVDEIDGLFDWRSVIVRGSLKIIHRGGPRADPDAYDEAVQATRTLVPDAFTARDPTPQRRIVFRIEPTDLTGREASTTYLVR